MIYLDKIRDALGEMTDAELGALQTIAWAAPAAGLALELLAFVVRACHWEVRRRDGHDVRFIGPHEMIAPGDIGVSLTTLAALVVGFGDNSPAVRTLLRAIADALHHEAPPTTRDTMPGKMHGPGSRSTRPWRGVRH